MSLEEKIKQSKPLKPELKFVLQIWYLQSRFQHIQQKHFDKFGLTPQQYNALRIINGQKKPCTLKTVKERLLDLNSDASRLIDRLVKAGLVVRLNSTKDRRTCQLLITDKGKKILSELSGVDQLFKNYFHNSDMKKLQDTIEFLDDLIGKMEV
ncbi:MAG: MarR family transcriptional regulator [Bacteroidia bacterium]|nr:MarR family transcriptional regulator [Bacteroidia bacterium]